MTATTTSAAERPVTNGTIANTADHRRPGADAPEDWAGESADFDRSEIRWFFREETRRGWRATR